MILMDLTIDRYIWSIIFFTVILVPKFIVVF